MFLKYRIHFYWDPDRVDPLADHPCNLMRHCREPVIRLTDLRPRQAHLRGRGGISRDRNRSLEVPSWTADLLQVLNSGPFNHDQQIYLLSMFHIFLCRCTATSLSSHSYVKKRSAILLGRVFTTMFCNQSVETRPKYGRPLSCRRSRLALLVQVNICSFSTCQRKPYLTRKNSGSGSAFIKGAIGSFLSCGSCTGDKI